MKKLLIVCGAGHATSTIAVAKVSAWLEKEGYSDKVKIYQSKIADELNENWWLWCGEYQQRSVPDLSKIKSFRDYHY